MAADDVASAGGRVATGSPGKRLLVL
jgi:hypothetical protein